MKKCRPVGGIFPVVGGRAVVLNIMSRRLLPHSGCCDAKIFGDSLNSAINGRQRSPRLVRLDVSFSPVCGPPTIDRQVASQRFVLSNVASNV